MKTKHQAETRLINRALIANADYNPRLISKEAEKKLRGSLRESGLVSTLTWNQRTGNLVGGHQRLAILDALEKRGDYEIDVSVVDLDDKEERELNILLNNPNVQGDYDIDRLAAMIPSIDVSNVGFELSDLQFMFDGTEHESLFSPPMDDEGASAAIVAGATSLIAEANLGERTAEAPNGRLANGQAIRDPEKHAAIIAERNAAKERAKNDPLHNEDFMLIIVCSTTAERNEIRAALGVMTTGRHVSGREILPVLREAGLALGEADS